MAYENSAGLNVHNHYGPRATGGEQGVFKTEGYNNEYVLDLRNPSGLNYKFPIRNNVKVVGVDVKFATGTVSAVAIGGTAVLSASESAPVTLAKTNTGVVTQTGGTGGVIVIKYRNIPGDAFTLEETDV